MKDTVEKVRRWMGYNTDKFSPASRRGVRGPMANSDRLPIDEPLPLHDIPEALRYHERNNR